MTTKLVPPNITPSNMYDPTEENQGNATFIAAAPSVASALLELLDDAEYAIEKLLPPGTYSMSFAVAKARQALLEAGYTLAADPE